MNTSASTLSARPATAPAAAARQAPLSYASTPGLDVPMRFFLCAPWFGMAAGLLLAWLPDLLVSRWTPGALAATHLVTVGFMLTVMLGALLQILPVVAGAELPAPRRVATWVHGGVCAGAAALAWGFLSMTTSLLFWGGVLVGAAFALFAGASAIALWRKPVAQATPRDLRLALPALAVALALGVALSWTLAGGTGLPFELAAAIRLHIGWAWLGGVGLLLAAASWVVVPMFQITPAYPAALTRWWAAAVLATLLAWSAAALAWPQRADTTLALLPLAAAFPLVTLRLQARSRRSRPDVMFRAFQFGMYCLLAGIACLPFALNGDGTVAPLLVGVLVLHGGFVSAIQAMLYKIVPFLSWLHLTQRGLKAPNVKRLLPDAPVKRQLAVHALSLPLLLGAAASGDAWLGRLAGLAVAVDFAWLGCNIAAVLARYRRQLAPPRADTPA